MSFAPLAAQQILGSSLPDHWTGWLGWLIGIWSGIAVIQVAVEAFIKGWGHKEGVLVRPSGFILPVGWVAWGGLLIYAYPGTGAVLPVLLGLLAMLIAATELVRKRHTLNMIPDNPVPISNQA